MGAAITGNTYTRKSLYVLFPTGHFREQRNFPAKNVLLFYEFFVLILQILTAQEDYWGNVDVI